MRSNPGRARQRRDSGNCSGLRPDARAFRVGLWLSLLRLFLESVLGFDQARPCPLSRSRRLDRPHSPRDGAGIFLVSCRAALRRTIPQSCPRDGNRCLKRVRCGNTGFPARAPHRSLTCAPTVFVPPKSTMPNSHANKARATASKNRTVTAALYNKEEANKEEAPPE